MHDSSKEKRPFMAFTVQYLKEAHRACFQNQEILKTSRQCACFFCNNLFPACEITEWCCDAQGNTALCPYCGIDSVIGDAAGYPLTPEFILAMHRYWFGLNRPMGDGHKSSYIKIVIEE